MLRHPLLLLALSALPACQCLQVVEECRGIHCPKDGGAHDAGLDAGYDGGLDAGDLDDLCAPWDGTGVGQCVAVTGYVFDGTQCQGACVQYPIVSLGVYPTLEECASTCALDRCRTELLSAVLPQPFTADAYCDDLRVSTVEPARIAEAFPTVDAGCGGDAGPTNCYLLFSQTLGDAGYLTACAATLVPGTTGVVCDLYGP